MNALIAEVEQLVEKRVPDASVRGREIPSSSSASVGGSAPKAYGITICFPAGTPVGDMMDTLRDIDKRQPLGYEMTGETQVEITLDLA